MNLSFTRGDEDERVRENFRRFCTAIGVPAERTVVSAAGASYQPARVHRSGLRTGGDPRAGLCGY